MSDADTHVQPSGGKSIRYWLWLAVIVLCVGGGGLRAWQNHQRELVLAAWQRRVLSMQKLYESDWDKADRRVRRLWDQSNRRRDSDGRPQPFTRSELEKILNGGKAFKPEANFTPNDQYDEVVRWYESYGLILAQFSFKDGLWVGALAVKQPVGVLPQYDYPMPTGLEHFTEQVQFGFAGRLELGWGTSAWLIAALIYLARLHHPRQQRILAEIMLALTLLCTAAWLTFPNYPLTFQGITSNDMLFWSLPMLALSGLAIWWARRKLNLPAWPTCAQCGYNLTGNVSGICPECGTPT